MPNSLESAGSLRETHRITKRSRSHNRPKIPGRMYENGQGAPQDYKEAAKWCRLAAEQGLTTAQFNLGAMYAKGQGVPQDYVQAYMWLNLAVATGGADGGRSRESTDKQMTPGQIAEAQRRAREWKLKTL